MINLNKQLIKYTSIFTLFILGFYILSSLVPASIVITEVKASNINNDDVYKGLGLALLLILISKIGKQFESNDQPESPPSTAKKVDLLARVIHAEARGESRRGQIAVAAVVLNRLKSNLFPDNVYDIIYQEKQFSSVDDGQILLKPNQDAYRAAHKALEGKDPTQGALYFYNPVKVKNEDWFKQNTVETVTIGNHKFAKPKI